MIKLNVCRLVLSIVFIFLSKSNLFFIKYYLILTKAALVFTSPALRNSAEFAGRKSGCFLATCWVPLIKRGISSAAGTMELPQPGALYLGSLQQATTPAPAVLPPDPIHRILQMRWKWMGGAALPATALPSPQTAPLFQLRLPTSLGVGINSGSIAL